MNTDLQIALSLLKRIVHGEPTRRDHYGYTIATDPYSEARQWLEAYERKHGMESPATLRIVRARAVSVAASAFLYRVKDLYPDALGRNRRSDFVRQRAAFFAVCHFDIGIGPSEIGSMTGFHHSSVLYHTSRHDAYMATWPGYADDYEGMKRLCDNVMNRAA